MIIFEAISKPLLILHTVAAIGFLGLMTHDFFLLIGYIKGNPRKISQELGVPSMEWYGRTAFALILSIPVGAIVFLIINSRKGEIPNESIWFKLAGIAAIFSLLLVMSFIIWHEYHLWIL